MGFENEEVNTIVFLGCMLTIITCSATVLYYRTSCIFDPVTLREVLQARRDIANRYGAHSRQHIIPTVRNRRRRKVMDVFRIKRITTQYEILTNDDKYWK
jgi:hypothetical protein